ncbi:MAG: response regulator transcription factor [Sandaracinus sp.]|nr:response regulator transcription factor [Sandaracinus sp.]MCB9614976.1 response regulator transcription factor [Sandaracinus sp.]
MTTRILLVEDDDALGSQVEGILRGDGFEVTWLRDGDRASKVDVTEFALIVLDLMLPGTYGLDLLKRWRAAEHEVPVLILSARQDTNDKVRALKLGADDYVTKPFFPDELLARINARLRRPDLRRGEGPLRLGRLEIDVEGREVRVDGASAPELTKVELDILVALAKRPGSALSRRALVDACLDPDKAGSERTLDVHVSRVRKKLGPAGGQLQTVWGIGYKLVADAPTEDA